MTRSVKEAIETRKRWERENVELARKYVSENNYREAATYYSNAAHHRAIRQALQAEGRK